MNIPQPRTVPILKNLLELDFEHPIQSFMRLSREYGEVVRVQMPGTAVILLGTQRAAAEVCDEARFHKMVGGPLEELRDFGGDGLFTAYHGEPNWELAHRILLPAFGPLAMRDYYDDMLDLTVQLVEKWERHGEETSHDVADEMTRLTLDTIALCGFGLRLNSFYREETHPFVEAMITALVEAMRRTGQPRMLTHVLRGRDRAYREAVRLMNHTVDEVIQHRRQTGEAGEDLLGRMLAGVDPLSGQSLSDINIRYQILTFLIAGHETTSGLLSFALHLLASHPDWMRHAQQEVDEVLGPDSDARPRFEDMPRLEVLDRVLKETLRLWPTAPLFTLTPHETTRICQDRYEVHPGQRLGVLIPMVQRDPAIWNEPERFDPDRFLAANEAELPPHAYTPFGSGARACIGRRFALQEAKLALAMLLHRFELTPEPGYELRIKEALTLKPDGLMMRARRRTPAQTPRSVPAISTPSEPVPSNPGHQTPMLILYGSNMGSTEHLARSLGDDARGHGYEVCVDDLDGAIDTLPTRGVVVIMSASYNGHPPDNAAKFCAWLDACAPEALAGVSYLVLGCGSKDWQHTYQNIPRALDDAMERAGANRLIPRGEADAAGDLFGDVDRWTQALWPSLTEALGIQEAEQTTRVSVTRTPRYRPEGYDSMRLEETRSLVDMSQPGARDKVHVRLNTTRSYRCGDQLAILAPTTTTTMTRLATRLAIDLEDIIVLERGPSWMPQARPLSLRDLIQWHVDLTEPVTRRALRAILAKTPCPPEAARVQEWLDAYDAQILVEHVTLLDALERTPGAQVQLEDVLAMASALRPRLYSIASAPQHEPNHIELTVSVDAFGHASRHLAERSAGDVLLGQVRSPSTACRPPADPTRPMLMIAAGSGLAAHRALLQWRAKSAASAPAHLFFGCDAEQTDLLYASELEAWIEQGVVELHTAFSTSTGDIRYVQHRLASEAACVRELLLRGAQVYVCGDGKHMGPAVREVLSEIARDAGLGEDWAQAQIASGDYINDVWAG